MGTRRPRSFALLLLSFVLIAAACGGEGGQPVPDGNGQETPSAGAPPERKSWAGTQPAPPFPQGPSWLNIPQPLTLADLQGKVVILDFWTQGCINCQHIIPDLKRLETEFGDVLAVIGVHSGKYATEHEDESVLEAARRYGLEHAVVNDPDFVFWDTYGARAWPTLVIIDPAGNLVGGHAGEGIYPLFQPIIASLVAEFEAKGVLDRMPLPFAPDVVSVSTIISFPSDVAAAAATGRLYIADAAHNRVIEAGLDGRVQRAFGSGDEGFADGAAAEATFRQPQGIELSEDGSTLYVADTRNHAIRAITLDSGEVRTIAGTGSQLDRLPAPGTPATEAALASPWDLIEVDGVLLITMAGIHQLWALDPRSGTIEVFAGTSREGIDNGPRLMMATLAQPSGITQVDGTLFWVDPESSSVRSVPAYGDGEVETLVGTGLFDYGDDDGTGLKAKLQHAQGITDGEGTLYLSDTYNHRIKALDRVSREVRTLSGGGERGYQDGAAAEAAFDEPGGLAFAAGRLYVADTNNHAIRVVDASTGDVTTLQLSNLAVLESGERGGADVVEFEGVSSGPGAGTIRISISAPPGYHLNSQAPGRLVLRSGDNTVVAIAQGALTWSSDAPSFEGDLPAEFGIGHTTITGDLSVYFCRDGEEALCFIHWVELRLPVTVAGGGPAVAALHYELPPVSP